MKNLKKMQNTELIVLLVCFYYELLFFFFDKFLFQFSILISLFNYYFFLIKFPYPFTDLFTIIKSVFSYSCFLDLISLKIFYDLSSFFYPIILNRINFSLATSKFSTFFKSSTVTPILKKPPLNLSIISNYRPITNLYFPQVF